LDKYQQKFSLKSETYSLLVLSRVRQYFEWGEGTSFLATPLHTHTHTHTHTRSGANRCWAMGWEDNFYCNFL